MLHENNNQPIIEELIAACKPNTSKEARVLLVKKLRNSFPEDEVLQGAMMFLEDNNYDFDALYEFLDLPIDLSASAIKVPVNFNYRRALAIAASITLLVGIVWLVIFRNNPQNQMAEAALHEPGLPVFATVDGKKDFHELMSAYRTQNAKTGLNFYYKLIKQEPLNDTLHYFGGWLFFINKQPDSAVVHFGKVATNAKSTYYYKAQYMKAISLYLDEQKKLSKELFKQIRMENISPYQKDALYLLSESKFW